MALYNDHGPGQSAPGDGPWQSYGEAPRCVIHPAGEFEGRAAYEMRNAAEEARIQALQLERLADNRFGKRGFELSRAEITAAVEACQKSLANAMALLTQSEAA